MCVFLLSLCVFVFIFVFLQYYCWLGLLTCETVSKITYTVLVGVQFVANDLHGNIIGCYTESYTLERTCIHAANVRNNFYGNMTWSDILKHIQERNRLCVLSAINGLHVAILWDITNKFTVEMLRNRFLVTCVENGLEQNHWWKDTEIRTPEKHFIRVLYAKKVLQRKTTWYVT